MTTSHGIDYNAHKMEAHARHHTSDKLHTLSQVDVTSLEGSSISLDDSQHVVLCGEKVGSTSFQYFISYVYRSAQEYNAVVSLASNITSVSDFKFNYWKNHFLCFQKVVIPTSKPGKLKCGEKCI